MAIKRNVLKRMAVVAVTTLVMGAVSAAALPIADGDYVDMYLKQNTFPSGLVEEKVYLDMDEALTITGHVGSQIGTQLVKFSSTTDILDAANGFATIYSKFGFDQLKQIQISGLKPVPEPATMLLLGFGLIGISSLGRKNLLKKS